MSQLENDSLCRVLNNVGVGVGCGSIGCEDENEWEMKNDRVVLPLRRILGNSQQAPIISFLG